MVLYVTALGYCLIAGGLLAWNLGCSHTSVTLTGSTPRFFLNHWLANYKSFVGKVKSLVGKDKSLVGKDKSFVGKDKSLVGKDKSFVGKDKSFVGKVMSNSSKKARGEAPLNVTDV